ncbi:lactosylceramide 4-alpha-galactosyltransferase [Daphnia magna]|uniref:lactosylceramide 4-alpha-galactosyltransferase n=1 Tax=Daphnia magna TaxID=35525 RepID=UPI001E1BC9A9|nr:lactosylceramide 4-alpha-galactosyltransferase [Daphnia magna]
MESKDIATGHPKSCWRSNSWKRIWLKRRANINYERSFLLIFGSAGLVIIVYNILIASPIPICLIPDDLTTVSPSESPRELKHNYDFLSEGDKAFFWETGGNQTLNIRQACAVESLALHNPSVTVYMLFSQERVNRSSITLRTLTENYKNIRIIGINMNNFMTGSALEHWYKFTDWRKGPFNVSHFSDALRFATLSKYGGYYFDLDLIHLQPVTHYRNFFATEDGIIVSAGAIHADYGHPIMKLAISDFVVNYRADVWGHNGPALLGRVITKWCAVPKLREATYLRCRGFSVLPNASFYPVHYPRWREFFHQRAPNDTMTPDWLTTEVIGVHIWNKISYGEPVYRNSTQYYTQLARTHCPAIFSITPDVF